MKTLRHTLSALAFGLLTISAFAQDTASSSSTIVRRRADNDRSRSTTQGTGVTDRMAQHFGADQGANDASRVWMRIIYRDLELDNIKNAPLYYPEEIVDGQENLFRIIMRLLADGQISAYEYLDGKEIFSDQYRIKVRDMLDRFHILYSDAKGATEKNPRFTIEESDVPTNEVLSYYLLERWDFDANSNKTKRTVEAIAPVLHRSDDFGSDAVRYPMFWVKMADIRPYLAQQFIFIDDSNNLPKYTYDDFFTMSLYEGDIYKTRNLTNKSMMQMFPDPDDRKRAQDSIQNRLDTFDKNIWVPSREEVIAAREAREAAEAAEKAKAEGTELSSRDGDDEAPAKTTRTSRRSAKAKATPKSTTKKAKVAKPKAAKSSSSSAVRSVRRRK